MLRSKLYHQETDELTKAIPSCLKNTTILITGGSGLIGTVLIDVLKNDKSIKIIAPRSSEWDIRLSAPDSIKNKKIDYIINLASNTHPLLYATQPIGTIDTIVSGAKNVFELAASVKVKRVINISSVEVYGENRGDVERFTEDYLGYINCNACRSGYTEGKRLVEAMCQAYITEKGLDIVTARLGRVYGATFLDSDTKSTSQFIRNAVNGEDIILKSDGKQEYSYVYVSDVVSAFFVLLEKGETGEAYNIANDEVKTFAETAEFLASMNGKKVVFDIPSATERAGFSVVVKALMDSTKMKGLGWSAKYNLENGLSRVVQILKDEKK